MKEKKKIRIAIYSRKSKYSDKGDSVGNQIEIAKEYIKMHFPEDEYEVEIVIYEDEGFSGGSFDRPQFKIFLEDERANPYDILICYRLDRISRNIADFSALMNELNELETSFISIKEQFDTKTPMGRAMMYIASVFAQLEREVIAERIRDNLLELSKTGTWLGGEAPLGFTAERYKKVEVCEQENDYIAKKSKVASKLVENEEELKTILLIYSKFMELKSLSKLVTYLMNNDIKTRKGVYFGISALRKILTSPVYAKNDEDTMEYFASQNIYIYCEDDDRNKYDGKYGFLTYNKTSGYGGKEKPMQEWIIAVGLHKGIIAGKEWVAVQMLIEKNADKKYRAALSVKTNTLATGLLRCKHCNSLMRAKNMGRAYKDGSINYRYCCTLKEKSRGHKCQSLNVGNEIDNKILEILKTTFIPNTEVYEELKKMATIKSTDNSNSELEFLQNAYNKNLEETEKLIEKLQYIDIDLMDMVNCKLRELKEQKQNLENQIANIKSRGKIKDTSEMQTAKDLLKVIDNSFDIFHTFDLKTKRDIVGLFIEKMYGDGENIEIFLLNTKLEDSKKKFFIPTISKTENSFNKCLSSDKVSKIQKWHSIQKVGKSNPKRIYVERICSK